MTKMRNTGKQGNNLVKKSKPEKKRTTHKKPRKNALTSSKKEELLHDLKVKQVQIDIQKQELLQQRDQLEISRDKYADLYDFAPVGYLTLNEHGVIIESNLTASEILGIERKFIQKIPFINMLVTQDMRRFIKDLRDCENHNSQMIDEFTIRNRKNGLLSIQISALPVIDYITKEMTYRLSLTDITEKKKIMDELRESEKRFRLMSNSSPAMIWLSDEKNNLIYLNKRGLNFYGKTLEELQGKVWFQLTHPDDRDKFEAKFSSALKEKLPFDMEIRIKNNKSEFRWIYYSAAPRFLNNNEFEGYVGIGIDLTEKNKLRVELENSLKEKEILLKEIHHRVKNNLQIITSILSQQVHYLNNNSIEEILKGCKFRVLSLSLLHEQLYRSKDLININLEEYVRAIYDNLYSSYSNVSTDINFFLDIEDVSLDLEISINLGLIINELISNSLKYAFKGRNKGKISVSLKYIENSEKLVLKVSDNGIGLPDDFNTNSHKSLGFELVLSLVEQLKGELEIKKNGETEFQIII